MSISLLLLQEAGISRTSYNSVILAIVFALIYIFLPSLIHQKKYTMPSIIYRLLHVTLIVPIIVLLTFRVGYLSVYDFTHYAGPVYDVLSGLPPLSSVSYYGFLGILSLAKIFTFIPLTLLNLHIVFGVFETLGFLLYYLLSLLLFRSPLYAFLITLFGVSANWLTGITPIGSSPQATLFRFGLWIILACTLYQQSQGKKIRMFIYSFITYMLIVLSVFWAFDSGMYIVIAYVIHGYILSLRTTLSATVTTFAKCILPIVYSFLFGFILIQTIYYFIYSTFPNWINFISPSMSFISSPLLIPFPHGILPWILLAPPVVYICFFLTKFCTTSYTACAAKEKTIHFIAWYSIIQFVYFVGRSHPNNLHHIVLPNAICFFALIEQIERGIKHSRPLVKMLINLCLAFIIAYPMTLLSVQSYSNIRKENFVTSMRTIRTPKGTELDTFGTTTRLIQQKYQEFISSDATGILALYDTWYLILLHAKNRVGSNCLLCVHDPLSLKKIAETIRVNRPKYLFVDIYYSSYIGSYYDQVSKIFPFIQDIYVYRETLGLLDIYERRK